MRCWTMTTALPLGKHEMDRLLSLLRGMIGERHVLTGEAIPVGNMRDESKVPPGRPEALLLPASTAEVSGCLRLCHAAGQRVALQGGLTGLAGGAIPQPGEIALSFRRMSGIEEVDPSGRCLVALAGTPLAEVQSAARAAGMECGIDLGSRGSCTIGGNVATNAGGNHVIRYGMTRRNILGLEAVLSDGTVLSHLNRMQKDNTGYDWTQMLVGSEGTLAAITRVVVALHPAPRSIHTALCAVADVPALLALRQALSADVHLLTFEALWREYMEIALDGLSMRQPFATRPDITVLVEIEGGDEDGFAALLAAAMEDGIIGDAVISRSLADRERLWAYREATYSFGTLRPATAAFDVSLPHNRMADFVDLFRDRMARFFPDARPMFFGHFADGNLHLSIAHDDLTQSLAVRMDDEVYDIVSKLAGSISAEHGIGVAKRPYLHLSRSPEEVALMENMKRAFDPASILNHGRILSCLAGGPVQVEGNDRVEAFC